MRIKLDSLLYWQFYLIIGVMCNLGVLSLTGDVYTCLEIMGYVYTFELIAFIVVNTLLHGRFFNFGNIFILVLFIFHFGQLVLYTFFRNAYSHIRILLLLEPSDVFRGFCQIHMVFTALCVGMLLSDVKSQRGLISARAMRINQQYDFAKVSKWIIYLTFPVKLLIDILCLYKSVTAGATAAREWVNDFPNVLLYYGKVALVGFALLLLTLRNQPQKQKKLFLFIIGYILVVMLSGIRSENVGYICIFALLYFASKAKRTRIRHLVLYAVTGYFVLAFVDATGQFRGVANKSVTAFLEVYLSCLTERNVIFSFLDTLGDTGYTAQCVINKWLPEYGPSYGDSYYLGWIAVIPNIPGILTFPGTITAESAFPLKLQEMHTLSNDYHNIGGSLIGEFFFNFGLAGALLLGFALGLFLGNVSYKSKSYIEKNNYYGMLWLIPTMFAATYWVRDYFGGVIREAVWGPLLGLLVMKLFFGVKKKMRP